MNGKYCVDANVFITPWCTSYPINTFPTLWKQIAQHRNDIILIKPIYDEIEPISSIDNKLSQPEKKDKYPLRTWLTKNNFPEYPINDNINLLSLSMEQEYQIDDKSNGADQNDMLLIAYAKIMDQIVVTFEAYQKPKPNKKSNYKIPLICEEKKVNCISFIDMINALGIKV
ncbi:DUF4411 family protein [Candidatus Spongiihabitans sp.]|uniref:DUF4411 family protein n=1 Tax=Candidatus Spongiihabitans sp. TaxID=3101308 RepID=UPI003C7A6878